MSSTSFLAKNFSTFSWEVEYDAFFKWFWNFICSKSSTVIVIKVTLRNERFV